MDKCKDGGICGLGGFCLGCQIVDIEVRGCFSCDKKFIAECHNDRDEGYFCDDCLDNKE